MKLDLTDELIKTLDVPTGKKNISHTSSKSKGLKLSLHYVDQELIIEWSYRYTIPGGKRSELKIGNWPLFNQEKALEKVGHFKNLLQQGIDPAAAENRKKQSNASKIENLLVEPRYRINSISEKWLEHCELTKSINTTKKYRSAYKVHLLKKFGHLDIRYFDVLEYEKHIHSIEKISAASSAHRAMRAMFSYAVKKLKIINSNPLLSLEEVNKAVQVHPRERYLSSEEVSKFLNELDNQKLSEDAKLALRLQMHTGLRIGEILSIMWSEIDFKARKIKHPGIAMKNGKPATTITSDAIRRLLLEWKRDNNLTRDRVFEKCLNTSTINDEMKKIQKWISFGTHDLRRTMRTYLQYLGCPEEIRTMITNHAEKTGVAAHYDQAQLDKIQLDWLTKWAESLDKVKQDKTALMFGIEADDDDDLLQEFAEIL